MKGFLFAGACLAGSAVALGAFGAHALKERLTDYQLTIFEVAVRYQMYHALALVSVGLLQQHLNSSLLSAAGWSFSIGTVLFSGSLYAIVWSGIKVLGAITPIGGLGFIIGWACLAAAALRL